MIQTAAWPFVKMHGLGNDFVVLDARTRALALTPERVRALADRRTGIGCDQLVVIAPAKGQVSDATMLIFNADGSEVSACGNATRCVAWHLMRESGASKVVIETRAGLLDAESRGEHLVAVDMGRPGLDWRDIPLARAVDTLHLGIAAGPLADPVGVSMGNPHAVFFVENAEAVDLAAFGPGLEHHSLFPERANIEAAQVLTPPDAALGRIRMRVWERGSGITMACGTGACATLVAAARRGLSPRKAEIVLDGGLLAIEWLPDDHVLMTGPVATSFAGVLDPTLLP
ncbi:diaminopimelate epimerase [Magnetospirillum sp. SS-4]|uniref:diaminopimelate epimerase n=1 Tax=Magnetospirillum sp. SS-4 TaxID=2681465 RepID=UPI00137C5F4A|nr:diaminopimelate epimerase [Magnetospirillum sp. SS-4]CAA7616648.1 Diaminopimelate epimerase [Magnetospirillum sp. SS-4]